jgi:hypothetical protein
MYFVPAVIEKYLRGFKDFTFAYIITKSNPNNDRVAENTWLQI